MEELFEMINKRINEDGETTEEEKKDLTISLRLMEMALTSNDSKIEALGQSVDMLCQMQDFTPFELCAACCCLIAGACKEQLKISDMDMAVAFYKHVLDTLEKTIEKVLEEESNGSKDDDCSCKCE